VASTVTVSGATQAEVSGALSGLATGVASALGVDATSVVASNVRAGARRRALLQASTVLVDISVTVPSTSNAAAIAQGLITASDSGAIASALGLPGATAALASAPVEVSSSGVQSSIAGIEYVPSSSEGSTTPIPDYTYDTYFEEEEEEVVSLPPPPPKIEVVTISEPAEIVVIVAETVAKAECAEGFVEDDNGVCQDINFCLDAPCHSLSTCTDDITTFSCSACPSGYAGDGIGTLGCINIDECATDNGGCWEDPSGGGGKVQCTDTPGAYTCGACADIAGPVQYRGDGSSCTAVSGCETDNGGCDPLTECQDLGAGASLCGPCPAQGYVAGDGSSACVEIDGCKVPVENPCYPGVTCTDLPPPSDGHTCGACPSGMEGDGTACAEIDSCDAADYPCAVLPDYDITIGCTDLAAPKNGFLCDNCPIGFKGDGISPSHGGVGCEPTSPCASSPCFPGTTCTDEAAPRTGYVCGPCPDGFEGDARETCTDILECSAEPGPCWAEGDLSSECIETDGGYECGACPEGFRGDGYSGCQLVTQCDNENGGCWKSLEHPTVLSECVDGEGDADSTCGMCPSEGFEGDGYTGCREIDGCAASPCFNDASAGFAVKCTDQPAECYMADTALIPTDILPGCTLGTPPSAPFQCAGCPPGYKSTGATAAGIGQGGCALCALALTIVDSNIVDGKAKRAQDIRIFSELQPLDDGCVSTGGFKYSWSLSSSDPSFKLVLNPTDHKSNTLAVFLPKKTLPAGQTYTIAVQACLNGNFKVCDYKETLVTVLASPLVAVIGGGGGTVGEDNPITLDGSASRDPDNEVGDIKYTWVCKDLEGMVCLSATGEELALPGTSKVTFNLLGGPASAPKQYTFTLKVQKGGRVSSVETGLRVEKGAPPILFIDPLATSKVNANRKLVLRGRGESVLPQSMSMQWEVFPQTGTEPWAIDLDAAGVVATSRSCSGFGAADTSANCDLVINPRILTPGQTYTFQLRAADQNGAVESQLDVRVNEPPAAIDVATALTVEPREGIALETKFTISTDKTQWNDDDAPLEYLYAYQVKGTDTAVLIADFSPLSSVETVLPQGDASSNEIEIAVVARDSLGAVAATTVKTTVQSALPVLEDDTAVNNFVNDKTAGMDEALGTGNYNAVLQLGDGLISLLNSNSEERRRRRQIGDSDSLATLLSRRGQRSKILQVVRDASSLALSTTTSAERSSRSIAEIVNVVEETDDGMRDSALAMGQGILADILDDRTETELSENTKTSLVSGLDSIATAAVADGDAEGGEGESPAVKQQGRVASLLGGLGSAQLKGKVAGEPAEQVSGRNLNMRTQRERAAQANDGRPLAPSALTTWPLLAGNSKAAFSLPKGLFDNVAASARDSLLQGVDVMMMTTSFNYRGSAVVADPNTNATNATALGGNATAANGTASGSVISGVASFGLKANNSEVAIQQLASPIYFKIPLSESARADPLTVVACRFWSEEEEAWSSDGCFSMPNPYPPGATLTWRKNFEVKYNESTGAIDEAHFGRSWLITHPTLFDNCNRTFEGDAGWRAWVSRGAGAACEAVDNNNTLGCFWAKEFQAFRGPGCVMAPEQECMCTHLTDFSALIEVPKIKFASLDELALTPQDIWNIKEMVAVTVALVALGFITAGIAEWCTLRKRKGFQWMVRNAAFGYKEESDGTWTWPFYMTISDSADHGEQVMSIGGPGPAIAHAMATQYNRVRLAVPYEIIGATVMSEADQLRKAFENRLKAANMDVKDAARSGLIDPLLLEWQRAAMTKKKAISLAAKLENLRLKKAVDLLSGNAPQEGPVDVDAAVLKFSKRWRHSVSATSTPTAAEGTLKKAASGKKPMPRRSGSSVGAKAVEKGEPSSAYAKYRTRVVAKRTAAQLAQRLVQEEEVDRKGFDVFEDIFSIVGESAGRRSYASKWEMAPVFAGSSGGNSRNITPGPSELQPTPLGSREAEVAAAPAEGGVAAVAADADAAAGGGEATEGASLAAAPGSFALPAIDADDEDDAPRPPDPMDIPPPAPPLSAGSSLREGSRESWYRDILASPRLLRSDSLSSGSITSPAGSIDSPRPLAPWEHLELPPPAPPMETYGGKGNPAEAPLNPVWRPTGALQRSPILQTAQSGTPPTGPLQNTESMGSASPGGIDGMSPSPGLSVHNERFIFDMEDDVVTAKLDKAKVLPPRSGLFALMGATDLKDIVIEKLGGLKSPNYVKSEYAIGLDVPMNFEEEQNDRMIGTAYVHALLSLRRVLPVEELMQQTILATSHFRRVSGSSSNFAFTDYVEIFKVP